MIGTAHPMALPIALLIQAEQKNHTTFEYGVYEVLNTYMRIRGWADEMKADLYAQLAETIKPEYMLTVKEAIVSVALWKTEEKFSG